MLNLNTVLTILFSGDEEEISDMEDRVSQFDHRAYWENSHATSLAVIAASQNGSAEKGNPEARANKAKETDLIENRSTSRHHHDGRQECHQATETVDAFRARLPPSSTKSSQIGQWIWIADRSSRVTGPSSEHIASLMREGGELLEEFEDCMSAIRAENERKSKAVLTRKINTERRKLEVELLKAARNNDVVMGKWMLFPSADLVDDTWAAVAHATAKGTLGPASKVATCPDTGDSNASARLVCVYTKDFDDREDIRRVLLKLIDMGVAGNIASNKGRPIYYKCDAYTYLDIKGGNTWGLKASMYASTDFLAKK